MLEQELHERHAELTLYRQILAATQQELAWSKQLIGVYEMPHVKIPEGCK